MSSTSPRADANSAIIVDYASNPSHSIANVGHIGDPAFKRYSSLVLGILQEKFGSFEIKSTDLSEISLDGVAIVRVPLVSDRKQPATIQTIADQSLSGDCVIASPWMNLSVQYSPHPELTGVIYWNERQLLRDRAVLDGLVDSGVADREHFLRSEYERSAKAYENSMLNVEAPAIINGSADLGLPPELLHLFRQAPQTTFAPFDSLALGTMREMAESSADPYASLLAAILDKCSQEETRDLQYSSIKDVLGAGTLEFNFKQ